MVVFYRIVRRVQIHLRCSGCVLLSRLQQLEVSRSPQMQLTDSLSRADPETLPVHADR